jgi:hypothetical protein
MFRFAAILFFAFIAIAANAEAPAFLGARCGASSSQLVTDGATVVENSEENRRKLGAELDPFYSVAGVGMPGLSTKLASRLPVFPQEFKFAELLFLDEHLIKLAVFFRPSDDTVKAHNALSLMNQIDRELSRKYSFSKTVERSEMPPLGLTYREHWKYESIGGTIKVGYAFREAGIQPRTQVMVRIDYSADCAKL